MNRKKELMLKGWIAENGLNINAANGGILTIIDTIKRLIKKHEDQCVNSCNGYGVVKGKVYYNGTIDDYAKRTYGYNVKTAYLNGTDKTIFDYEIDRIQNRLIHETRRINLGLKFQHDPRGNTVKLHRTGGLPCTYFGF